MPVGDMLALVQVEATKVIIRVLSVMTLITLADVVYQRFMHHTELRMTKQQVKDEHKQAEGDPLIKSRLRQIRVEPARTRMMAARQSVVQGPRVSVRVVHGGRRLIQTKKRRD